MPAKMPKSNRLNQTFSEDCLYLDIYVPGKICVFLLLEMNTNFFLVHFRIGKSIEGTSKPKTVFVFIRGGGFDGENLSRFTGGPDFLLSEDNIVVILAYRVGIFGFLNLNYGDYTGNMGLKDQQMALKWTHENIEYFSGNKDQILLLGHSKGKPFRIACMQKEN